MKNLKTELANLLNIIVGKTSLLEMSTDDFYPVLAQAIIDSGLMVDRESVEELVEAAQDVANGYAEFVLDNRMTRTIYQNSIGYLRQALSKFQAKGDVK